MKYLWRIGAVVLLLFVVAFCQNEMERVRGQKVASGPGGLETVITVWGQEHMGFTGHYGDLSGSRSVEGWTPAEFRFRPQGILSAVFQKSTGHSGILRVKIWRGDSLLAQQETTAQYGVVTMAVQVP